MARKSPPPFMANAVLNFHCLTLPLATYLAGICLAGLSTAACLHSNWFFRVSHVFADVVAVGGPHENGWRVLELFIFNRICVVHGKLA